MTPILEVENLTKYFPQPSKGRAAIQFSQTRVQGRESEMVRAVDDVSLTIPPGETLGLVGESGSGKSTIVRCVLRLIEPTAGRISFMGEDFLALSGPELRKRRKRIQAIFQDPYGSLNPRMKIGRIIEEPLLIHQLGDRRSRQRRVNELLELTGLDVADAEHYPHEFSGGQRLAIARGDEPVSALDVSIQAQILNLLQRLKEELQLTMLFVSHGLPIVRYLCDRVAVLHGGRVVELAGTEELFANPLHPYTCQLLEAVPEPDPRRQREKVEERQKKPVVVPLESLRGKLKEVTKGHWVLRRET